MQLFGLLTLAVIVIALPLYWLFEPSRQAGAREKGEAQLAKWGSELFATTAQGGFNCAGCHGGMKATGGAAPYTITDKTTGAVRAGHVERPGAEHGAATASARTRSGTSSSTAASSRRCPLGASPAAAR